MKTANLWFSVSWLLLAFISLGGALFTGALWHLGTAAMCLVLSRMLYNEYKSL